MSEWPTYRQTLAASPKGDFLIRPFLNGGEGFGLTYSSARWKSQDLCQAEDCNSGLTFGGNKVRKVPLMLLSDKEITANDELEASWNTSLLDAKKKGCKTVKWIVWASW